MADLMRELDITDASTGEERMLLWAEKLRNMQAECVAVLGGTPFDFVFVHLMFYPFYPFPMMMSLDSSTQTRWYQSGVHMETPQRSKNTPGPLSLHVRSRATSLSFPLTRRRVLFRQPSRV
jgi:hypothetical protein